jgi:hypothetical protein
MTENTEAMPLVVSEIDLKKVSYGPKKPVNKKGGPDMCKGSYEGKDFNVQAPHLIAPFGVSNAKTNPKYPSPVDKYTIEFSLDTNNKKVEAFKKFLTAFDEFNIEYIAKNSKELLKEEFTVAEVKKMKKYNRMVREKFDEKTGQKITDYPDKFRCKIQVTNNVPKFNVLKQNKVDGKKVWQTLVTADSPEPVDWSWSKPHMEVVPVMLYEGMWYIADKFTPVWKIEWLRIYDSSKVKLTANSYRPDSDDEKDSESGDEAGEAEADAEGPGNVEEEYEEDSDE